MSYSINNSFNTKSTEYRASVNIWDTDPKTGRCGHASVSIQKTGDSSEGLKKYLGMWPKYGWMVTPFTLLLAFPAKHLKSKMACMDREGDEAPLKPSRQYNIQITEAQHQSMNNEFNRINGKIKNRTTLYTLFPLFNLVRFAEKVATPSVIRQLHACPMTGMELDHPTLINDCQGIKELETDNCTTAAIKILNAGGIGVKTGSFPWGLAPTSLGDQLDVLKKTDSSISRK